VCLRRRGGEDVFLELTVLVGWWGNFLKDLIDNAPIDSSLHHPTFVLTSCDIVRGNMLCKMPTQACLSHYHPLCPWLSPCRMQL
jgi:hypothetical protein